uniref:VIT domain-containing protein n=1 Tax=Erpetoichthys calabaricus TaxID=27687 RepID=A0A8C4RLS4_ERPCA
MRRQKWSLVKNTSQKTALKLPLKSISVEIWAKDFIADVVSSLDYENTQSNPVEAEFIFPIEFGASIYDLHVDIGDTQIKATIKEKQEARNEYDNAISSGMQAFLLEESEESSDIFQLRIGSLSPGEKVSVSLSFVMEMDVQVDGAILLHLPTLLFPRYTPEGVQSLTTEIPYVPVGSVPYTLNLNAHLASLNGIASVQSNCGLSPIEYLNEEKTEAKISLSPGFKFDRDVQLLIYYTQKHKPTATVEAGLISAASGSLMVDPLVMVSFFPEINTDQKSKYGEFIFLVDCSGSMQEKMNNDPESPTRGKCDTMKLLIQSLPLGCYFNIYLFGSVFIAYYFKDLCNILKTVIFAPSSLSIFFQLFIFTDGEVENTKSVTDEVKKNSATHRCFTFGIGEGASTALVKGIAEASSGHFQFISGEDSLQSKVMQSLEFALQPAVTQIVLRWDVPAGVEVVPVSEAPVALFHNQRSVFYAQLKGKFEDDAVGCVSLQYNIYKLNCGCFISFYRLMAHRLAGKSLITHLEAEERLNRNNENEQRIISISTEAGVISAYTAFVAVRKDSNVAVQGPMISILIPRAHFQRSSECLFLFGFSISNVLCNCFKRNFLERKFCQLAVIMGHLQLLLVLRACLLNFSPQQMECLLNWIEIAVYNTLMVFSSPPVWDKRDICHCSQPAKPKDPGTTLYFTNDVLGEMEQTQSCGKHFLSSFNACQNLEQSVLQRIKILKKEFYICCVQCITLCVTPWHLS